VLEGAVVIQKGLARVLYLAFGLKVQVIKTFPRWSLRRVDLHAEAPPKLCPFLCHFCNRNRSEGVCLIRNRLGNVKSSVLQLLGKFDLRLASEVLVKPAEGRFKLFVDASDFNWFVFPAVFI